MQTLTPELPESLKELAAKEEQLNADKAEAAKLGVPLDKYYLMARYAKALLQKNPGMSAKKVMKKVAIQFNVKLT